jgi:hypothetical protein
MSASTFHAKKKPKQNKVNNYKTINRSINKTNNLDHTLRLKVSNNTKECLNQYVKIISQDIFISSIYFINVHAHIILEIIISNHMHNKIPTD